MFKIITQKERLQRAEAENKKLAQKNAELEEAILELAQIISEEGQHGEIILQQD